MKSFYRMMGSCVDVEQKWDVTQAVEGSEALGQLATLKYANFVKEVKIIIEYLRNNNWEDFRRNQKPDTKQETRDKSPLHFKRPVVWGDQAICKHIYYFFGY